MDFPNCTAENKNSLISIKDRGSKNSKVKVTLINRNQSPVKVIKIDGCVITEGIRCDYLVVVPEKKLIYIELKGKEISHAVEQIEETMNYISRTCKSSKSLGIVCLISCTRYPSGTTDTQIYKSRFQSQYGAKLIIKSGEVEHDIEEQCKRQQKKK